MRKLVYLPTAQRFSDAALLLLRLFIGLYLIWGVWDYVTSGETMQEYVIFLRTHEFIAPQVLAPISVYLQLGIGLAFVLGLFTRWAGILCAVHFAIALAMVDFKSGMRGVFPSGCLFVIGLFLATHGAGRFSFDEALRANEVPRAVGSVRLK